MHWFDIGIGIVMLIGGIRSYFRGLTREVMSTIGCIAVFVFAVWGNAYIPPYFEPIIASPWWRQIAVHIVLIMVAVSAYILWVKMVEHLLYLPLTIPDRVLGSLFGIVKVGILIAAGYVLLIPAAPERIAMAMSGSKLAPPLLQTSKLITTMLPRDVKDGFQRSYSRVQQQLGQRVAQPSHTKPTKFNTPSHAQPPKPPSGISESDDRTLRQLIKKYAQEQ
jgi:uncharacterized membrane protein required for colicin V production